MSGAFHSQFNEPMEKGAPVPFPSTRYICNFPILGIRPAKAKAPAGVPPMDKDKEDIIDEAIRLFKANVMFRNFEVRGYADRLLIYITVYISTLISKINLKSKGEADKIFFAFAIEPFSLPGDKTFCLGGLVTAPQNRADNEFIKAYLTYIRQETGSRLLEQVYAHGERLPDKWWVCFSKRKFLNKSL
jgi:actin related protein 2/3 complex subunit 3